MGILRTWVCVWWNQTGNDLKTWKVMFRVRKKERKGRYPVFELPRE